MQTQEHVREHELGDLLRYWRHERGKSNSIYLLIPGSRNGTSALWRAAVAVPSRDLLSILSEKLDIPLRERNVLLSLPATHPSTKNPLGTFLRWLRLPKRSIECSNRSRIPHSCWTATGM